MQQQFLNFEKKLRKCVDILKMFIYNTNVVTENETKINKGVQRVRRKYWPLQKVKGRMRELNITQKELAERLNIGRTTVSEKLNGVADLTRSEIIKIIEILSIAPEEYDEYFFYMQVTKTKHK